MKKTENKKRYFAISYFADSNIGDITLDCDSFPSRDRIVATIKKECYEKFKIDFKSIIIITIFEFKNKEDYNNYEKK